MAPCCLAWCTDLSTRREFSFPEDTRDTRVPAWGAAVSEFAEQEKKLKYLCKGSSRNLSHEQPISQRELHGPGWELVQPSLMHSTQIVI